MNLFSPPRRALLAAALALACLPVLASRDGDHDRARRALQAGEVLPLPQLLKSLETSHPGQVLEVELERDDGRWVYEVKLLQSEGRLSKLKFDARSGVVLQQRDKRR